MNSPRGLSKALGVGAIVTWLALGSLVLIDFWVFLATIAYGFSDMNLVPYTISAVMRGVGYIGALAWLLWAAGPGQRVRSVLLLRATLFVCVYAVGALDPLSRLLDSPYFVADPFRIAGAAVTFALVVAAFVLDRKHRNT